MKNWELGRELSAVASNALDAAGIETWAQLEKMSEVELLSIPRFGRKSLKEVREELAKRGVALPSLAASLLERAEPKRGVTQDEKDIWIAAYVAAAGPNIHVSHAHEAAAEAVLAYRRFCAREQVADVTGK